MFPIAKKMIESEQVDFLNLELYNRYGYMYIPLCVLNRLLNSAMLVTQFIYFDFQLVWGICLGLKPV